MMITVNGETLAVEARTLAALLDELGRQGPVATALNEAFVPAAARAATPIRQGDRVEILAPMQGG